MAIYRETLTNQKLYRRQKSTFAPSTGDKQKANFSSFIERKGHVAQINWSYGGMRLAEMDTWIHHIFYYTTLQ